MSPPEHYKDRVTGGGAVESPLAQKARHTVADGTQALGCGVPKEQASILGNEA